MSASLYAHDVCGGQSRKCGALAEESAGSGNEAQAQRSFHWLPFWNGFLVTSSVLLLVVDQKGPFGDAAKWFFCALIFAAFKGVMKVCLP